MVCDTAASGFAENTAKLLLIDGALTVSLVSELLWVGEIVMDISNRYWVQSGAMTTRSAQVQATSSRAIVGESSLEVESEEKLSSLSQKLSAAAERASQRDSQMSRKELAALAATIKEKIYGASYDFSKAVYDAQVPETDDEEWLARARQATDFLNGNGTNPFAGMSREQLSLIAYDESGDFTVNERRAAMDEANRQYCDWTRSISDKIWNEYQQTGSSVKALADVIAYYRALPPIEEAQFGNYESAATTQLTQQEVDWPEYNISLVTLIANGWEALLESDASADPQVDSSSTSRWEEGSRE